MSQLSPGPLYNGSAPVRDEGYKRFIKMLPCIACLNTWHIDPAHTGQHGLGQKSSDLSCIPLCRPCHDQYGADPVAFTERHRLDIPVLIGMFNSFWQTKLGGGKAA